MILTKDDILRWDKANRTNLINSLSGIRTAHLIGTVDGAGRTNLAVFNSVVHLGANPPLLGFIHRPPSADKHTYQNIQSTAFFTLNTVPTTHYVAAHQTSARYPSEVSEFEAAGFTPSYIEGFPAPFVEGSSMKVGLRLVEEHFIQANQTVLIVGEIQLMVVPEEGLSYDGTVLWDKMPPTLCAGLDSYYQASLLGRLAYAKPDLPPRPL